MSISVYARIKEKCVNKDLLKKAIKDFFQPEKDVFMQSDAKCVTYEGISEKNTIVIFFVSDNRPPYNIYDSGIINGEFEYMQSIIFDIDKEDTSVDRFAEIINFCIYLNGKIESEILVTSDVHNDICLVKTQEILWSQELSFDYKNMVTPQS